MLAQATKNPLAPLMAFALVLVLTGAAGAEEVQPSPVDAPPATTAPVVTPPETPPAKKPQGPGAPVVKKPAAPAKAAAKGIYLSPIAPVSPSVHVHDKVLEECRLQSLLPQLIAERSSEIVLSDAAGGAMKLELKIVDIHAPSGGWFSGPKWITVDGKLLQGKTVKGTFIAKETSMASATACGMLSKVMTVLAGDIAAWLQNPQKGSMLGSAR